MLSKSISRHVLCSIGCMLSVCLFCPVAYAQSSDPSVIGVGEVTTNDLYVRSGDSLNHYTITKLQAGDRVTIVSQRGNWFEILPPEGVFSLISGDFVDTTDDRTGVINGNKVRVRTGSLLNESKYTVQTHLSKGMEVTIFGRNPDGFLRIQPPDGATVWISREYVQMVPENRLGDAQNTSPPTLTGSGDALTETTTDTTEKPRPIIQPVTDYSNDRNSKTVNPTRETIRSTQTTTTRITAFQGLPPTDQRKALEVIDIAAKAEMDNPFFQRHWPRLIQQYQTIVDQDEDKLAATYAVKRIEQLNSMAALVETVRKMRKLDDLAQSKRREAMEGRSEIQEFVPSKPSGLDAQGELRISALYPPGTIPRRFRLVDTSGQNIRTIGYVEIPVGSNLSVDAFLGRMVGIRASSKKLQEGGVEPIPIYLAKEIVLMETQESVDSK